MLRIRVLTRFRSPCLSLSPIILEKFMRNSVHLPVNAGIDVCAIGLGAMPLSLRGRPSDSTAMEVIRSFVDSGGHFIDTANVYCRDEQEVGHNENLVYRGLKDIRHDDVYVATKGGLRMNGDNWTVDGSPAWLRMCCEHSLMHLNTSSIFLYQLHAPDPDIDILESVGEMMRMQSEGMIQHIGLSNVTRRQLRRVTEMTTVFSVQNRCNLFHREDMDQGLVAICRENNILYIAHSPVGGHYNHANLMGNNIVGRVAGKHETSSYCIALAWLLHQGDNILPIPGASKPESIVSSLSARYITLDEEDINELEKLKI